MHIGRVGHGRDQWTHRCGREEGALQSRLQVRDTTAMAAARVRPARRRACCVSPAAQWGRNPRPAASPAATSTMSVTERSTDNTRWSPGPARRRGVDQRGRVHARDDVEPHVGSVRRRGDVGVHVDGVHWIGGDGRAGAPRYEPAARSRSRHPRKKARASARWSGLSTNSLSGWRAPRNASAFQTSLAGAASKSNGAT